MPFCPHCERNVSDRTFRDHKLHFFNTDDRLWTTKDENPIVNNSIDPADHTLHKEQLEETFVGECVDDQNDLPVQPLPHHIENDIQDINFTVDIEQESEDTPQDNDQNDNGNLNVLGTWFTLYFAIWVDSCNISERAAECFLHFLFTFFSVLCTVVPGLSIILDILPRTIHRLYKKLSLKTDNFTKYIVCPKCSMIYEYNQVVPNVAQQRTIRNCQAVKFPNHPHRNKRIQCGQCLVKVVKYNHGERKFIPVKVYCYRNISDNLKSLLSRQNVLNLSQEWKKRTHIAGYFRDVYDGKIWREFQTVNNLPFLAGECNIGFMLNIDWFQPFKFSPYSVGAVYMSIMNLPRNMRFKRENIILVGLLPGPNETDADGLCHFIKPLVDELLNLWNNGINITVGERLITVKAALLCIAADLPAARKLCGFLGHAAKLGCSKCSKEFKTGNFGDKTDFGGFAREQPRSAEDHKRHIHGCKSATCQSTRAEYQRQHGARYTELVRLPYIDLIRMTIIDPMHNLFLGTAKYMFKDVWASKHQLNDKNKLKNIQTLVDSVKNPKEIGRIPQKISQNFSSFTADQWKNWCLYYSLFAVKAHLPTQAYLVWTYFVEACHLLCQPTIHIAELSKANKCLLQFCREFERLYGSIMITPNMHFHTHLIDCILDFGPVYAFWLFGFERYNGSLGSFHTNKKDVEIQMFRKFQKSQELKCIPHSDQYRAEFAKSFSNLSSTDVGSLSISHCQATEEVIVKAKQQMQGEIVYGRHWLSDDRIKMHGNHRTGIVTGTHLQFLRTSVQTFMPQLNPQSVSGAFQMFTSCTYLGEHFGCVERPSSLSENVLASWTGLDGNIIPTESLHPGQIMYFMRFHVKLHNDEEVQTIDMAYVRWFQHHGDHDYFHKELASVWALPNDFFQPDGPASFMPMQRIHGKFVQGFITVKGEPVTVVMKRNNRLIW